MISTAPQSKRGYYCVRAKKIAFFKVIYYFTNAGVYFKSALGKSRGDKKELQSGAEVSILDYEGG